MQEETKKINKKPMFRVINEQYETTKESELDSRKKHLASIRDLHQPLDHEALVEHKKKMDEIVKEKVDKWKKDREDRVVELAKSYDYSKYKSKFTENILEQEQLILEKREKKDEERAKI